ncbi:MAG: hypothetical protein ACRDMZ_14225, partial [Solirubrobacteraceae bacterium]
MTPRLSRILAALAAALAGCAAPPAAAPSTPAAGASPAASTHATTGAAPEIYGAGVFSTGAWDFFVAFTPDQRRALFCRADDTFTHYDIYETRLDARGHWSAPVKPRFAARWSNADPHISPDGRRVYFISNRPIAANAAGAEREIHDIWTAALQPDGEWSDAERLPAPVNDLATDRWSPAVAASGNLYFGAELPGGLGGDDLWVVRKSGDHYLPPENLGDAINTAGREVEPWIAPDESYLIFSGLRRADSLGGYDLYLSERVDGRWTPARRLPEPINSPSGDFNQSVSPDGRWLYFSSNR